MEVPSTSTMSIWSRFHPTQQKDPESNRWYLDMVESQITWSAVRRHDSKHDHDLIGVTQMGKPHLAQTLSDLWLPWYQIEPILLKSISQLWSASWASFSLVLSSERHVRPALMTRPVLDLALTFSLSIRSVRMSSRMVLQQMTELWSIW